jgi:hypothetical protein
MQDFDMTLVDQHTGGRWLGTNVAELGDRVRPFFKDFIPLAVSKNLCVGIATFSPQVGVVKSVLEYAFGDSLAARIAIRGNDGSWTDGAYSKREDGSWLPVGDKT